MFNLEEQATHLSFHKLVQILDRLRLQSLLC
jgi:hypothetical protein